MRPANPHRSAQRKLQRKGRGRPSAQAAKSGADDRATILHELDVHRVELEMQNQDLLRSMDVRAKLQMKLSHLVEGLSVFAVSYYVFSLLKYVIDPWTGHSEWAHKLYGGLIALILALAWLFIHHRKKSLTGGED